MAFISDQDRARAAENGINENNLYNRVYNCGWTVERAVTEPVNSKTHALWPKYRELAEKNGISQMYFYKRVREHGMTPEQAATTPREHGGMAAT